MNPTPDPCRGLDIAADFTTTARQREESGTLLLKASQLAFEKRLVCVGKPRTAGYMATNYEPIYGLSEDEVSFICNQANTETQNGVVGYYERLRAEMAND